MSNSNDERILLLKKQIETKKEKLGKSTRFAPVTNCNLEILDVRYNINTLDEEKLTSLLIYLNSQLMSAKVLGVDIEKFLVSGYTLTDWYTDVETRLDILSRTKEEKSLKLMEDKLVKMLSDGKKTELEIDEIESLLKE